MNPRQTQHEFNLVRSLQVFVAIAEHGQMTRAAAALNISQSAVSQHLTNLESHYQTELVDRALRPMRLTLTGQALLQHAREIMRKIDSVDSDLRQLEQTVIPMLRVAMLPSLATLLTPLLIAQARERYEVASISLHADLANSHQNLIQSRQVDLLVTSQPFYNIDGLTRYAIMREQFLLVLPPEFGEFDGNLETLAGRLPMMRFSESTPAGLLIDQHLRRCNTRIERMLDADRTTMIMASVAAGHAFSILSPSLLLDGLIEGMSLDLRPLPIRPLQREILLAHRDGELDRLPRELAGAIQQCLRQSVGHWIAGGGQWVEFEALP